MTTSLCQNSAHSEQFGFQGKITKPRAVTIFLSSLGNEKK